MCIDTSIYIYIYIRRPLTRGLEGVCESALPPSWILPLEAKFGPKPPSSPLTTLNRCASESCFRLRHLAKMIFGRGLGLAS